MHRQQQQHAHAPLVLVRPSSATTLRAATKSSAAPPFPRAQAILVKYLADSMNAVTETLKRAGQVPSSSQVWCPRCSKVERGEQHESCASSRPAWCVAASVAAVAAGCQARTRSRGAGAQRHLGARQRRRQCSFAPAALGHAPARQHVTAHSSTCSRPRAACTQRRAALGLAPAGAAPAPPATPTAAASQRGGHAAGAPAESQADACRRRRQAAATSSSAASSTALAPAAPANGASSAAAQTAAGINQQAAYGAWDSGRRGRRAGTRRGRAAAHRGCP